MILTGTGAMHLGHTSQDELPGTLRLPQFASVITDREIMSSVLKEKSQPAFPCKSDVYS